MQTATRCCCNTGSGGCVCKRTPRGGYTACCCLCTVQIVVRSVSAHARVDSREEDSNSLLVSLLLPCLCCVGVAKQSTFTFARAEEKQLNMFPPTNASDTRLFINLIMKLVSFS